MRADTARGADAALPATRHPRKKSPMRRVNLALGLLLLPLGFAQADEGAKTAVLYKNPQCGCCEAYADYLRDCRWARRA